MLMLITEHGVTVRVRVVPELFLVFMVFISTDTSTSIISA